MEHNDNIDQVSERYYDLCARFYALYARICPEALARDEFEADELYAFQAFRRALRSENEELRDLAARLQEQRQTGLETIELDGAEQFGSRRPKMESRKAQPAARAAPAILAPLPAKPAAAAPVAPPAAPRPAAAPPSDRRAGAARMSPEELEIAGWLRRLYQRRFGEPMDIPRFKLDDDYGRQVLQASLASSDAELVALARGYLDSAGAPCAHRRRSPR